MTMFDEYADPRRQQTLNLLSKNGACKEDDVDLSWFFPVMEDEEGYTGQDVNGQMEKAKQVCRRCPVMEECLDYALTYKEVYGVWGGMTPKQRQKTRKALGLPSQAPNVCEECRKVYVPKGGGSRFCSKGCNDRNKHRRDRQSPGNIPMVNLPRVAS